MNNEKCKHENLGPMAANVLDGEVPGEFGSLLIDVWCADCGLSGAVVIRPEDVNWGDEDDDELLPDIEGTAHDDRVN